MQFDFKKSRIDLLAIGLFIVVSFLYCLPQLQGKKLQQSDNLQWQAMAHEGMAYHDSTGKDVLWSNSMFGGMPSYTTYIGTKNVNYAYNVQMILESLGKPAYFFFIAMLCFYILMRVLKVNRWLGMIGAFAYAFSSYNAIIIVVGHDTKMLTLCYLPALLAGFYLIYRQKWLYGAALAALSSALIFSNMHFQVIYYAVIMFVCFGISMLVMAIREGKIKEFIISSVIAIVAFLIGMGPSISGILTTNEYAKATMRGGQSELAGHDAKPSGGLDKEYAFRWSNGIGETFCVMIPYLYGGGDAEDVGTGSNSYKALTNLGVPEESAEGFCEHLPTYWGPQPFIAGPVYFGAVICFLFVLGLTLIKPIHKWWIIAASAICIMLSWGKNFADLNYFLFDHLPYLNKFRTPSMALVIPEFLFPVLGILALNEVLFGNISKDDIWKKVRLSVIVTAGLCLLLGVGGSLFFNFRSDNDERLKQQFSQQFGGGERGTEAAGQLVKAIQDDRASMASRSGLMSAVLIVLAGGLIWAYSKDKVKAPVVIGGIAVLVIASLYPVAHNYLSDKNYVDGSEYDEAFQPRDVDKQILRDPDPYYRVLDLSKDPYNDASQAYFHKCVGGYSPAKMESYQDLIDRQMSKGFNGEVLNMLNTKYIISGRGNRLGVIPNPKACGNAWFVDEVKWANTAEDEMNGLNAPDISDTAAMPDAFDAKKTAVMRATFKDALGNYTFGKDSAAYVKLDKYGLDDISFKSSNSKDGLAVFSDIYYPKGWKAYIDGKETPIMKADYVLRAIKIPAGAHSIEFHFHPDSFYNGQKAALASSILLIILCIGAFVPLFTKKNEAA